MRILSCHIVGFGKFLSRTFDFTAPLTCIKEENGWGKSTLADFIECMLYGMDGGRSKSVSDNMRIKYQPLFGNGYGGVMHVESKGMRYRIERSFGKTPSADTAKIYDSNNMVCYDFGERCERLGETLVGVNRESYRKTAYIAQGAGGEFGLSENLKSKLIALLSTAGQGEGALSALARLDTADRALRAKRKPAKGKLDEIDERLYLLERERDNCERAEVRAKSLRSEITALSTRKEALKGQIAEFAQRIENASRQKEYEAREQAKREIRVRVETAKEHPASIEQFFNGVAPQTVNLDGVKSATAEYYQLEQTLHQKRAELLQTQTSRAERESVRLQLEASEKALEANALRVENVQSLKKQKKREQPYKITRKSRFIFLLALASFFVGATQIATLPALGYVLFAVGGVGILWQLKGMLASVRGMGKIKGERSAQSDFDDAQSTCERLREKLLGYPDDLDEQSGRLQSEITAGETRKTALKDGIERFLQNFTFGEIYDYRTAVERLEENIVKHAEYTRLLALGQADLARAEENETGDSIAQSAEDMLSVKMEQGRVNAEKEQVENELARQSLELESLENQASRLDGVLAETEILLEEKNRLEKRLKAIRYAKELLVKAQGNTASKYLTPVEKRCQEYEKSAGFIADVERLRFTLDATPILEENGTLVGVDYFSDGIKDLLGFCVRLALYETVFGTDAPPLILDDPFVNLDDNKTSKAQTLVRQLSTRAQVIYFTCKSERVL